MDHNLITIVLGSGDPSVTQGSNASKFTSLLASPLDLSHGEWEVCLVNISCARPAVVPRSLFVFCDLCEVQTIGSSLRPLLDRLRPITAADPQYPVFIETTSSVIPWKPCVKRQYNQITVEIVDSTGAPIQTNLGESIVELVIRQVAI
jgi:hypothetical protein